MAPLLGLVNMLMRSLFLKDYPDQIGAVMHQLLNGEHYRLTGEYMWGELVWCLSVRSDISVNRWQMLNLLLSEYIVDTQLVRDWKDY